MADESKLDHTEEHKRYWKTNIQIVIFMLVIWFTVSCGMGIFFVKQLNTVKLGGFPLGFWFAQQGSIFIFIGLILCYALLMDREDKKFHVEEEGGQHDVEEDA